MATTYINPFVFAGEELGGMVLLTPTSIAYTGTSASIGTNGSVEFTACSSLSLNGVFSADYDNYTVSIRATHNLTGSTYYETILYRMRSSGTDNTTASSYTNQMLRADSTSIAGVRGSGASGWLFNFSYNTNKHNGGTANFYGPFLSQPTAVRSTNVSGYLGAGLEDYASTHNQSVSYDGITVFPSSSNITGLVSVYGLVGA